MIEQLDHIVILADDLERAIADYTALGFTVLRGGSHPGRGSHNALIAFADGVYLELIAFTRPEPGFRWWEVNSVAGEGLVDFALLPHDTAAAVAEARARGVAYDGPNDGGRLRPDGQRLAWQTAQPPSSDLPFLCGDVTPRTLRVASGAATEHANGAQGVAEVTVLVDDPAASAARYRALLGGAAGFAEPAGAASGVAIALGAAQIVLHSPADTAGQELLARRGQGPSAIRLRGPGPRRALDAALTHGAAIAIGER